MLHGLDFWRHDVDLNCYTQNLEAPKRQTVNKVPEGADQSEDLCKLVQNLRSGRLSSEAFADVPELAGSRYFRTWWTWGPDWRRFRSSGLWTSAPPPRSPRPTCVPRSPAPPTRSDTQTHRGGESNQPTRLPGPTTRMKEFLYKG